MRQTMIAVLKPLVDRLYKGTTWKKGPDGPRNIGVPFNNVMLNEHVMGSAQFGLAQITPGTDTTRVAVLDFDSHKGETSWPDMVAKVREVRDVLRSMGYGPVVWRSSGGMGMHLFCTWDTPQDAYSVREAMFDALALCDLKNGTGGVAKGMVEVFPKQSEVHADDKGNMFILPFANQSRLLDENTFEPIAPVDTEAPWLSAAPVAKRVKPPRTVREDYSIEDSKLRSALAAIPNEEPNELSYEPWRNVIFAIHHETDGSDEGLALAHEFSARSSKYDPDFLNNRVWCYAHSNRDRPITGGTILFDARKQGWVDPTLEDDYSMELGALVSGDGRGTGGSEVAIQTGVGGVAGSYQDHLAGRDPLPRTAVPAGSAAAGAPQESVATGPVAGPTLTPAAAAVRFTFVPLAKFRPGKRVPDLIEDVLPWAALGVLYGESGSGKSFFVLDMVLAIARGAMWRGRATQKVRVAYIVAEGAAGFRARADAYCEHHGVDIESIDVVLVPHAPNFLKADQVKEIIDGLKARGPFGLVVVDTLAQVMPGSNENSSEDMGAAVSHCRSIHEHTKAMVLLVHHAGKDASKGARGWSGLRAAADCEIEIVRNGDDRLATLTKLKDGEDGLQFPFTLTTVDVDIDADTGKQITSCIVEPAENRPQKAGNGPLVPKNANDLMLYRALHELLPMGSCDVSEEAAIEKFVPMLSGKTQHGRLQAYDRSIQRLEQDGFVTVEGRVAKNAKDVARNGIIHVRVEADSDY